MMHRGWEAVNQVEEGTMTAASEQPAEQPSEGRDYWESGYVVGLLVSRYYFLRGGAAAPLFSEPAPVEAPAIVQSLLSAMCRESVNRHLFGDSWQSLDGLLLSKTPEELQIALRTISGASIQ
jgi:hypothetical protein